MPGADEEQAAGAELPPSPKAAQTWGSALAKAEAERIEHMAEALQGQAPPWATGCLQSAMPALHVIGSGCAAVGPPLLVLAKGGYAVAQRVPTTAARGLWGLGMSFFGGRYAVSIAACEAFRSMGGSTAYMCIKDLVAQASAVWAANMDDDGEDADKDGIADVQQMEIRKLFSRKLLLVLKTADPEVVTRAVGGLWTAYMGVIMVLKVQFAQTVALARSIGDALRPTLAKAIGPPLVAVAPPEFHKWISPGINLLCKLTAACAAWRLQKLTSTVQSGFVGGLIASRALLQLLREQKLMEVTDDQTCMDEVLGWSVGACGIYVQLFKGGPVPTVLSPLFWPLDILERILQWNVTWMSPPEALDK